MINTILSWLVIGLLIFWFVLSILNQNRKWRNVIAPIANRDICSLIPIWTFFAPNPGRTDIYLLYRDRDGEGNISSWREIRTGYRNSLFLVWSPKRRIHKGIVDLTSNFTKGVDYKPHQPVGKQQVVSFQYLLILNYVCSRPVDFRADMRQFAIARTDGHGTENNPEVIFLSAFHKIDHLN